MFNDLVQKLYHESYLTLETTPIHGAKIDSLITQIKKYNLNEKVTALSTTDNPLAKLKYSSLFAAIKLQNEFNKPVIATISMRDKNKIALQSDLLGANDFNVRAILSLTGDPAKMSNQPHTKGVFESNSNMLLDIINSFNNGMDYAGHLFKSKPKTIIPFSVVNSFSKSFKSLEKKMYQKIQKGAVGIITQPIYDVKNARLLLSHFNKAKSNFTDKRNNSQLIFGIFPITKLRTAQFLSSHVPGIHVPNEWMDMLSKASQVSVEEEYKVGMQLSAKLYNEIKKMHFKVHLMAANKYSVINEIIR